MALASEETFAILDSPPEIRNRIYFFAIPHDEAFHLESNKIRAATLSSKCYPNGGVPGVCQTSKQLRSESLPIWRSSNRFGATQLGSMKKEPPFHIDPSIEDILLPHLGGGFEHTRCLRWTVIADKVPVPGRLSAMFFSTLRLDGSHVQLALESWQDCFAKNVECLVAGRSGTRKLMEAKGLNMVLLLERLLERKPSWECTVSCHYCKRERQMKP